MRKYTHDEVYHDTKIKIYPNGDRKIIVASKPVFKDPCFELSVDKPVDKVVENIPVAKRNNEDNIMRSLRRAKEQCRDIAYCNQFTHFITLTLSPEKINRYDISDIYTKLKVWLSNRVQRNNLKYVLIPEHHKDGAIHFHGFFAGDMRYIYALTSKEGIDVYNIDGFDLGFTTAIPIYGEYKKAVSYVLKYMTKDTKKIGGRWYYSGGRLNKPDIVLADTGNAYADGINEQPKYSFSIPVTNTIFRVYEKSGEI